MRTRCSSLLCSLALVAVATCVPHAVFGQTPTKDRWFLSATSFNAPGPAARMARPDFLGSSDWRSCAGGHFESPPASFYGVWSLLKYDRKHHIALARGVTDQCSLALFQAPPPPGITAPDADLSHYGTVRGLRIGSPYAKVVALYGPPVKHGARFVTSYSAPVPAIAMNRKRVTLDERITLVVRNGYVSSISVYIEEAGLF